LSDYLQRSYESRNRKKNNTLGISAVQHTDPGLYIRSGSIYPKSGVCHTLDFSPAHYPFRAVALEGTLGKKKNKPDYRTKIEKAKY
jgi:hypothetical protein